MAASGGVRTSGVGAFDVGGNFGVGALDVALELPVSAPLMCSHPWARQLLVLAPLMFRQPWAW